MFAIVILITGIILSICYCSLIFLYKVWFQKLQQFNLPVNLVPATSFSIIIPARNEEKNIQQCLESIFSNEYPPQLFEVIVIDDFSDDRTAEIIINLQHKYTNLHLLSLSKIIDSKINSYKKKAIEIAISKACNQWVVTTDADCIVNKKWLAFFDAFVQKNDCVFIAAPVMLINSNSFLSVFQCLDFMSLQGITAASVSAGFHSMCNGANLAYEKNAFYAVDGFKGVDNIASGDDMLLMHKIKQTYPGKIGYLFSKEAITKTLPMPDVKNFINQRIRWASKAKSYADKKIFFVLLLVYLYNLFLFLCLIAGLFNAVVLLYLLAFIIAKTVSELFFLNNVARFFSQQRMLGWFAIMQPFHIVYTVFSGLLGNFGTYKWKGRTVK